MWSESKRPLSVLLTSDGTYPCYRGGVSVWCDQLIRRLSDVSFELVAITYSPSHAPIFQVPDNVRSCHILPLWGTDEPGEFATLPSRSYKRSIETTPEVIRGQLLGPFERMLRSLAPGASPEELAASLVQLHGLFLSYDYPSAMISPWFWEAFLRSSQMVVPEDRMALEDGTWCMRWLQRYLAVLCVDYPRADVTHSSMSGIAGVPCVLQKLLHSTPFVLSEHGIFLRELYVSIGRMECSLTCKRFLLNFNKAVVRMNYHFADTVTSLCEFNRRWQERLGVDARKITVISNGIDSERFSPGPIASRPNPIILTMARIYPLKGIHHLLRAARLVLDRVPEARFRILGDVADSGYFQECLELLSSLRLSAAVEFGKTNDSAGAYRDADIFCLPSISEAMPYAVLEAMFSGCPVVATDVGGVPEMIGGVGLLVTPADEVQLADALLSLLQGQEGSVRRQKLASAALARARARYTEHQCMGRFQEIYREPFAAQTSSEVPASRHDRPRLVATA